MQPPAYDVEFLREHSGYVRSLARKLVFDEQAAQDIEQQTWLAALEHAPRDPRSPRAWLAQLVRNFAFAAWRVQKRREQRERAVSRREDAVTTPAEVLERESVRRTLVEAVLAVDEPYRTALILRFIDDLDAREIARRLHAPLATVRTRIKRGQEMVRANLRRRHGDEYGAWSIALVHLLRLEPASYRAVATAAAKTLIQGALVMTVVQKIVIGAAAVVVLAASLFLWQRIDAVQRNSSALAALAAEAENLHLPQPEADPVETPTQSDRSEVAPQHAAPPPAESKPVDAHFGSLALHVVWGDDKKPAAGIHVKLYQSSSEDFYRDAIFRTTGDDGALVLEDLLPGNIAFEIDRSAHGRAVIEAGQRAEASIEVEYGFDVTGRVLDENAHPVAGADVYVWGYGGDSFEGFVVGRSRDDGRYSVRSLPPDRPSWISARAAGYAPTAQKMLIAGAGAKVESDLAFTSPGGVIEGRVLDSDGRPLAGASVVVGEMRDHADVRFDDGSTGRSPAAQRAVADAAGRYRIEGIAEGPQPVLARSKGLAAYRGGTQIAIGRTTTFDITLAQGSRLTGVVRDESGNPLVRAEVTVGGYGFTASTRRTRADGTFEMNDTPIGEFEVFVEDDAGTARKTLFGVSGATVHWDAVVSKGLMLRGRVEAPGRELEDWVIEADGEGYRFHQVVGTDARGRFEIVNCPDAALHLKVSAPGFATWPEAELEGVRAGPGEVVVTPDPALAPSIHIRGRVLGADGEPLGGVQVIPRNSRYPSSPILTSDTPSGRFDFGPYPAGEWRIEVTAPGYAPFSTDARTVAAGEALELGDVQLSTAGSFVATLTRDSSVRRVETWFIVRTVVGDVSMPIKASETELRSGPLAPGRYVVAVIEGEVFAALSHEVEVRAGEESHIDLHLRAK